MWALAFLIVLNGSRLILNDLRRPIVLFQSSILSQACIILISRSVSSTSGRRQGGVGEGRMLTLSARNSMVHLGMIRAESVNFVIVQKY